MTVQHTISQLANQCVLCGLCLPHCPTYQVFHTENESPRGRISLFKALADGDLSLSDPLFNSLDHCLGCRACEKMCPSQVDYSRITDLSRQLLVQSIQTQQSIKQKVAETVLQNPSLRSLAKLSSRLTGKASLEESYPVDNAIGSVALFTGCTGELFETQTLLDGITLLNACGYEVIVPPDQYCCGAIKRRQGDLDGMYQQINNNIELFTPLLTPQATPQVKDCQAVISLNNHCSGQLKEYAHLMIGSDSQNMAEHSFDIITFLHQAFKNKTPEFLPLQNSIIMHTSCSLKNVLNEAAHLESLLAYIPELQINKLDAKICCGAAGSYRLRYPEIANQLLNDKLQQIMHFDSPLLVSSNLGCSMHYTQGLKKQGLDVEILHPVSLLVRQLKESVEC